MFLSVQLIDVRSFVHPTRQHKQNSFWKSCWIDEEVQVDSRCCQQIRHVMNFWKKKNSIDDNMTLQAVLVVIMKSSLSICKLWIKYKERDVLLQNSIQVRIDEDKIFQKKSSMNFFNLDTNVNIRKRKTFLNVIFAESSRSFKKSRELYLDDSINLLNDENAFLKN